MRALSASLDFPSRPAAPRKTGLRNGPRRIAATILGLTALLAAAPASAVTLDYGVVLITQADALAGGVTPGDTPGFPVTLSVSGSYRLASNLLVNTAVNGIDVSAPEVTIDLAGFRIAGSGVGQSAIFGLDQRALTVKNGTIRGFTEYAVISGNNLTVNRMRNVDNPVPASTLSIIYGENNITVKRNNIARNGASQAANCFNFCRVENNIIVGNGELISAVKVDGIGSIILGNTISKFTNPLISPGFTNASTFGDNIFVGNVSGSQATLLPLDPNQPPPPP